MLAAGLLLAMIGVSGCDNSDGQGAAVADSSGMDDRQLRRLHQAVADAVADVDMLVKAGLLGGTDAALLKEELDLLADHEKPHPAVIEKALKTTERDITLLTDAAQLRMLPPTEQGEAERSRRRAQACVAKIKARLAAATPTPRQPGR